MSTSPTTVEGMSAYQPRRNDQPYHHHFRVLENLQRDWLAGRLYHSSEETDCCGQKGPRFSNRMRSRTVTGGMHNSSEATRVVLRESPTTLQHKQEPTAASVGGGFIHMHQSRGRVLHMD